MATQEYIRKIEVRGLWNVCDLVWELSPEVNILSGSNGSGKSTVLRCLSDLFTRGAVSAGHRCRMRSIEVEFADGRRAGSDHPFDPAAFHVAVISTFDTTLQESEAIYKLSDGTVATYLDWELYRLQNRYLTYQLEVGKRVIAALQAGRTMEDITSLTTRRTQYFDIIDALLEATGKRVDRESDTLQFLTQYGTMISPHQLSSGEKQILIILTTVLIQSGRDFILIMDEPEISLHFDWQRRLIDDVRTLNPNLQLILATHSPALVMNGWTDRVTEISDIVHPMAE
ncbi:AAA family ATPase [uncultured Rikenella sp.]|uniref:AAA family ATPase n=1 Tax=uncultured Rikenella sp. TaxID=368003 RepID=UPI00272B4977|nr:AAA family ATPase [uncultured Rikenella sp.]